MAIKNYLFLFLIFFPSLFYTQIQQIGGILQEQQIQTHEKCGFDSYHRELLLNDPTYLQKTNEFRELVRNYVPQKAAAAYIIPVVVHVISDGTTLTEITDQQIKDAIKGLNERLRNLSGLGNDTEIEYALAVRDPNGNCTNGIVRYDYSGNGAYTSFGVRRSGGSGTTDATLKALSVWDQSQYYNMWLVSEIDNNNGRTGTQGYATFASAHGTSSDGAVMLVNTFKNPDGTTLIHELGHSLNLYHTFEGDGTGSTCPSNADCNVDGDEVCDTPPHKRSNSDCLINTNDATCNNVDRDLYVHNYMDYSSDLCQYMFSPGQITRMQAAIDNERASFLAINGNMALVPIYAPTAEFYASKYYVCGTGQNVKFYDQSTCSPNTYMLDASWSGITYSWNITNNSGTTYTSSVQNPEITIGALGTYDVTLTITTAQGTSTLTKAGMLVVGSATADQFCLTPNSSNDGNYLHTISNVTFNTINKSSSMLNNTEYTNDACNISTIVSPNTTYEMSVTINAGGSGTENLEVYIDYDSDGVLDAGELVLSGSTATNTSSIITSNVLIPAGVTLDTPLRMRVIADAAGIQPSDRTCGAMFIGEVEDYTVYASNNIASVTITSSDIDNTFTYGTNITFTATPINGGASPTYKWYVNGEEVAGQTASTFSSTTLLDDDVVYCKLFSNMIGVIASPATSNSLTMIVTGTPISDFSVNVTAGCSSTTFNFTDESALAPTIWSWTFTGGTCLDPSVQNPSVTYTLPGTYAVTLTASNGYGAGTTMTKTGYITIYGSPAASCIVNRDQAPVGGIGITNVTLNTINNSTANNDAVMMDFTCTKQTTLNTNTLYNISMTGSSVNSQWVRAYIDYNNDGDFNDAGENIWSPANAMGTRSGTFTVPASPTLNTLLRMRIISDFVNTVPGACTNLLDYGQVEEYGVIIKDLPTVSATTPSARCGAGSSTISATASAGSINWYLTATGGSALVDDATYDLLGNSLTINNLTSTTTFYAEADNAGNVSSSRTAVVASVFECTAIKPSICGTTLAGLSSAIICLPVTGATMYKFELVEGANTHIVESVQRNIYCSNFNYKNRTAYTIRVAAKVGGVYSPYGDACVVTTGHPLTKVQTSQCGTTLQYLNSSIIADNVKGATIYRFKIEDGVNIYIRDKTVRAITLNDFPYQLNKAYTVSVCTQINSVFGSYGASCVVTTPHPLTQVQASQCGSTLQYINSSIIADHVLSATIYRFKIEDGVNTYIVDKNARAITLNDFPYQLNNDYTISVCTQINGSFGAYGNSCVVWTPLTSTVWSIQNPEDEISLIETDFTLEAYPNPNDGNFTISSSHEGKFNIINELGQLIQTVEITKENNYQVQVGSNNNSTTTLHPGIYFITGTINNEVVTKKIVVQ